LHLLVFDRSRRAALAARCGARWLLPIVCCSERARIGLLVLRWAAERNLSGDVIGQWHGRVAAAANTVDWLVIFALTKRPTASVPSFGWIPLGSLKNSASLLEYQQWVVAKATDEAGLLSSPGPFGALAWLADVKRWVCEVSALAHVGPATPYRTSPFEVVLGLSTLR